MKHWKSGDFNLHLHTTVVNKRLAHVFLKFNTTQTIQKHLYWPTGMSISELMLTQDDIVIVGSNKFSCKEDLSCNTNDYGLGLIKE